MSSSILVHCCCAHCAAYTLEYWKNRNYAVTAYWYNPNIHPYSEHQQRLEAMSALTAKMSVPFLVAEGYDMPEYFRRVAGHEDERCKPCFEMRLLKTARHARENGFSAFTTTLLISPQQKHELIKATGEKVSRETGSPFAYVDLRKRYSDSRHITKPMDIYRQQYCGCIYSEYERFINQEHQP